MTHEHADAVLGLDDIRTVQPFSPTNDIDPTPIYLTQFAMERYYILELGYCCLYMFSPDVNLICSRKFFPKKQMELIISKGIVGILYTVAETLFHMANVGFSTREHSCFNFYSCSYLSGYIQLEFDIW